MEKAIEIINQRIEKHSTEMQGFYDSETDLVNGKRIGDLRKLIAELEALKKDLA